MTRAFLAIGRELVWALREIARAAAGHSEEDEPPYQSLLIDGMHMWLALVLGAVAAPLLSWRWMARAYLVLKEGRDWRRGALAFDSFAIDAPIMVASLALAGAIDGTWAITGAVTYGLLARAAWRAWRVT
ncbi:hypothetical protein SAMN05444722_3737 [Rhodovulum sp. ES.010]|uniref:hypothetical protein n=1 Tax=Rhodovulum sp. ES.010 TaxID=1882821 RepID=UPI0009279AE7|nr:hypothetical protein [Rhodovulum sp. ES.010]SIO57481.1 hypothetical protein SAMN05444722_3737 [Rhodovulum sp. ES.010]